MEIDDEPPTIPEPLSLPSRLSDPLSSLPSSDNRKRKRLEDSEGSHRNEARIHVFSSNGSTHTRNSRRPRSHTHYGTLGSTILINCDQIKVQESDRLWSIDDPAYKNTIYTTDWALYIRHSQGSVKDVGLRRRGPWKMPGRRLRSGRRCSGRVVAAPWVPHTVPARPSCSRPDAPPVRAAR